MKIFFDLLIGLGCFAFIILIFLSIREINCWYWKINERLSILKEIKNLLTNINK